MKNKRKPYLTVLDVAFPGVLSLMSAYCSYKAAKLIPYTYEMFIKNAETTEQLIRFSTLEGLLGFTTLFCTASAGFLGYFSITHLKDTFSRER